jgi:hypothetical protein
MTGHEMITRNTPFEGFVSYLQIYLDGRRFNQFLAEKQSPFTQQEFLFFFNQNTVQQTLAHYWEYERGPQWKNRSASEAASETIGHALTQLAIETEEFRPMTNLLIDYFENVFPQHE